MDKQNDKHFNLIKKKAFSIFVLNSRGLFAYCVVHSTANSEDRVYTT